MPLPNEDINWPPENMTPVYNLYSEHDAWYSGDPNRIANVYASKVFTPTPKGMFWAKVENEERRVMLHVPIAGDIATTSADLLFSEPPKINIPEADDKNKDAEKTQERLDYIRSKGKIDEKLSEAAENCAALGDIYLKVNWDSELIDIPIFSIAQADNAIPEFKFGIMTAITFWKEIDSDGDIYYRLLERHEKGKIYNGLYKGTSSKLGKQIDLKNHSYTANLPEVISTLVNDILVRHIPNMKPNRRFRGSSLGQSDFSGSEGLMDALDEVYTSWMRDIRLGKGRLIVPEYFLSADKDGNLGFDGDQEAFVALDMDPESAEKNGITINQFEIRTEQHKNTALELLDRIISNAGYSPQSFGLKIEGRAESGTALNIRERKSFITAAKKANYWKSALEDILYMMMQIDITQLGQKYSLFRPVVEIQDSVETDLTQIAASVELLNRAQAASIETKVRMVNPDWNDEQVEAEVQKIYKENGMAAPNPDDVGIA